MKHLIPSILAGLAMACSTASPGPESGVPVHSTIRDAAGKAVGTLELTQEAAGVRLKLEVRGLAPGKHGMHFHEVGRCEGAGFTSAGAHFRASHQKHGGHWGDLPNLDAGRDGTAKLDHVTSNVTLTSGDRSLLREGGTALMIHAKPDDGSTDPSGNSGDRVACAVITR